MCVTLKHQTLNDDFNYYEGLFGPESVHEAEKDVFIWNLCGAVVPNQDARSPQGENKK